MIEMVGGIGFEPPLPLPDPVLFALQLIVVPPLAQIQLHVYAHVMIVRLAFVTTDEEIPVLQREVIGAVITVVPLVEPQLPFTSVPHVEAPPPGFPHPELPPPELPPLDPPPEPKLRLFPTIPVPVFSPFPVTGVVPHLGTLVLFFVSVVVRVLRGTDRLVLVVEAIA